MSDTQTHYGPWALVTGASSGIGAEFAHQLAGQGYHLVLAARRLDRLQALAQELEQVHAVQVRPIQVDLSRPNGAQIIQDATQDLEIGLLVNNAGAEIHGAFLDNDAEAAQKLIQLNATTPMQLAHSFGTKMSQRGHGGILFVASTVAYGATPYLANYAATKAYILSLGEALHYELKKTGVDVTVLSPGLTDTEMSRNMEKTGADFSKTPMPLLEADQTVSTGLKALGKKASVIPGTINNMFNFMGKHIMSRNASTNMFGHMLEKAFERS